MIERLRRLREEAGYNLVEMITVMVIMTVVFAGITTVFVAGSKAQSDQERRFQAQVFATTAVTLKVPAGCGGDVSWCTAAVSGYSNRYRLYRQSGATCDSTGVMVADYLTSGNVFPAFAHVTGCLCLASLQVDFNVSVTGTSVGAYDLTDTIFLRNSTRI